MLNQDGTRKTDPITGQPIATYTNEDIVNFSRGWTNFKERENERDNIEPEWSPVSNYCVCYYTIIFNDFKNDNKFIAYTSQDWMANKIDPMFLPTSEARGKPPTIASRGLLRCVKTDRISWRSTDVFPKSTLLVDGKRGFIGDQRFPRCDAMPDKAWLRRGAVWQFRENSQSLLGKQDPEWWSAPETWSPRMVLDPVKSILYKKLCKMNNTTGTCQFQSTVILDEDIICNGTCRAVRAKWDGGIPSSCECSVDEPRTVRIDHSANVGELSVAEKTTLLLFVFAPYTCVLHRSCLV